MDSSKRKEKYRKRGEYDDRRGGYPSQEKSLAVPSIRDTLKQLIEADMLPAIWVIFSRKKCDSAVPIAASSFQLISRSEEKRIRLALADLQSR